MELITTIALVNDAKRTASLANADLYDPAKFRDRFDLGLKQSM